jgi:hypothetical protein
VYFVFAFVQLLFGRVMWGIRLADLALIVTAAALLYAILRRALPSTVVARWLALGFILASASRSWFHVSQPDGWASALIIMALFPLIGRDRVSKIGWLVSGLVIGASSLIKPFYALFLFVPLTLAVVRRQLTLRVFLELVLGAALPVASVSIWFFANGALDDFVDVYITFNRNAYSDLSYNRREIVENLAAYFWNGGPNTPPGPFAVLLAPIVTAMFMAVRDKRSKDLVLVVWLAIALACVAIQGKFFVYHWLITFPPLLCIAGIGLSRFYQETAFGRVFTAVSIGIFIAGVANHPARDTIQAAKYLAGIQSREEYLGKFMRFNYRPLSTLTAAAYIQSHTRSDETVAIFGVDTGLYFPSGRAAATRFMLVLPLRVPSDVYRQAYRKEFIADLEKNIPRYIVLGTHEDETTISPSDRGMSLGQSISAACGACADFPELKAILSGRYRLETRIGGLDLYRLDRSAWR